MQNHSARYRPSYPQREMIRNVNTQPHDKDILFPCVNCTSIIHLQCILKPFSNIFHSVHFFLSWHEMVNSFSRTEEKLSSLDLTLYNPLRITHSFAKWMHRHKHLPQDHHIGLLCLTYQQSNTLRAFKQRNSLL